MARPREFDTDKAVLDAMNVFWRNGYDGASLPDLLSGMGITRGSLYKAFTDKKRLFLVSLARYEEDVVAKAVAALKDASIPNGYDRIERFLTSVTQDICGGDTRGCLICTTAAEAADDDETEAIIHKLLADLQSGIAAALTAANPPVTEADRTDMANLLLTNYIGLRIRARAETPAPELDRSISTLMHLLRNQTPRPSKPA